MDIILMDDNNRKFFLPYIPDPVATHLDSPFCLAIGAVDSGIAVGTTIAYMHDDVLVLEWIYVTPDRRTKGVATQMLQRLIKILAGGNVVLLQCSFSMCDKLAPLERLLHRCGFSLDETDEETCSESKLGDLVFPDSMGRGDRKGIVPLPEVPQLYFNKFSAFLGGAGVSPLELPLRRANYLECSHFHMSGDGVIGACLVRLLADNVIELSFLYAQQTMAVPALICATFESLRKSYPPDTVVRACAVTAASAHLIKKLAPNAVFTQIITMEYKFERRDT